jgi:hypothetical protein
MQNTEEQILSYPHLSAERQEEIESYVEDHPEWAPLLQDVRTLESFAPPVEDGPSPDPLLTTYVVVQRLHPEEVPGGLRRAFRRLERQMEENPTLRERAETVRARLAAAEAKVDPVSHFEELTGHSLEGVTDAAPSPEKTATPPSEEASDRAPTPVREVVDRVLQLPLALRWAGAAVGVLLGTYAVLFAASEASTTTLDRLAAVEVSNQVVGNYTSTATRSAVPSPDTLTADQLYIDALTAVRQARTSTLGLFPSYDPEQLDEAEGLLNRVLERTESGSFLSLEAQFYLGKVHLAQGQVSSAQERLRTVVEREGRMAAEARDILEVLENEYPEPAAE